MIIGLGNDIIDIRRIDKTLERFGDRFVQRIFTELEQKNPTDGATAQSPTPSVLPPRRQQPKPWERAFAKVFFGAISE